MSTSRIDWKSSLAAVAILYRRYMSLSGRPSTKQTLLATVWLPIKWAMSKASIAAERAVGLGVQLQRPLQRCPSLWSGSSISALGLGLPIVTLVTAVIELLQRLDLVAERGGLLEVQRERGGLHVLLQLPHHLTLRLPVRKRTKRSMSRR